MKVLGVIVEYNPLHNGHMYHLQKSIELVEADYVVAVMSGNVVQRGQVAIMDKWTRAELAVKLGVDLVVELPAVFTLQNADIFAKRSIEILSYLGVTDICFGSESGDVEALKKLSVLSVQIDKSEIEKHLKCGYSYPKAMELALGDKSNCELSEQFSLPNNILALAYIKYIKELACDINIHTVKRCGSGYHNSVLSSDNFSSATAIRAAILQNKDVKGEVPLDVYNRLKDYPLLCNNDFFSYLKFTVIRSTLLELEGIHLVSEGIEYKIKKELPIAGDWDRLLDILSSKRYTKSRINRILWNIALNIKKLDMDKINGSVLPYIRVLGFNVKGRDILAGCRKKEGIPPVIQKLSGVECALARYEISLTQMYASVSGQSDLFRREFSSAVIVK